MALLDALLFQSNGYLTLGALGVDLPRLGNQFRIAAPASVYRCRDGLVMAGVLLDAHWRMLARLLGRPELADDPALRDEPGAPRPARGGRRRWSPTGSRSAPSPRSSSSSARRASPSPRCAATPRPPATRTCASATCSRRCEVEGARRVPIAGPAAKLSRTPLRVRTGAPALGAHTDEILAELGVDAEERAELGGAA